MQGVWAQSAVQGEDEEVSFLGRGGAEGSGWKLTEDRMVQFEAR